MVEPSAQNRELPAACVKGCAVQFQLQLSAPDQYTPLGPRQLVMEVTVGEAKAELQLAEQ